MKRALHTLGLKSRSTSVKREAKTLQRKRVIQGVRAQFIPLTAHSSTSLSPPTGHRQPIGSMPPPPMGGVPTMPKSSPLRKRRVGLGGDSVSSNTHLASLRSRHRVWYGSGRPLLRSLYSGALHEFSEHTLEVAITIPPPNRSSELHNL